MVENDPGDENHAPLADNLTRLKEFRDRYVTHLAEDASGSLVYFAPSLINLRLVQEKWPEVSFAATREHVFLAA